MPLAPVTVEKFGGLRLSSDPGDVGMNGATDMLNVELAYDGSRVFTRDGSAVIASGLPGTTYAMAPARFGGTDVMLATGITTGTTIFLNRGGTAITTWSGPNLGDTPPSIVTFGTPTDSYAYVAWPRVALRRYDGTSVSTANGAPGYLAVTAQSNRLVQAWYGAANETPTGANGSRSTVFFSDPGQPEVYGANSYVHLRPGDGEEITGVVTWRELTFVFKETHAFVFYGESTDNSGQPVFNYRQISLASPINRYTADFARVGAGPGGVYFLANDGVYRTTGSTPTKVSSVLDTSVDFSRVPFTFSVAGDRVAFATDLNGSHYVMDERSGEWSFWKLNVNPVIRAPLTVWPRMAEALSGTADTSRSLVYAGSSSLYRLAPGVTSDAGIPFQSRYRMGVTDLGSPSQKIIREVLVDGSGVVRVGSGVDWGTNPVGDTVTLGTAPAVAQGRGRTAVRGRNFRVQISADSGAWSVNRMVLHLRSQRPVGVESR